MRSSLRTIAIAIFTLWFVPLAYAEQSLQAPPCQRPEPDATVKGWLQACRHKEGEPMLMGEYRCRLDDGAWVSIHYWACDEKKPTQAAK